MPVRSLTARATINFNAIFGAKLCMAINLIHFAVKKGRNGGRNHHHIHAYLYKAYMYMYLYAAMLPHTHFIWHFFTIRSQHLFPCSCTRILVKLLFIYMEYLGFNFICLVVGWLALDLFYNRNAIFQKRDDKNHHNRKVKS